MLNWLDNIRSYLASNSTIKSTFGKKIYLQSVLNESIDDTICIVLREFNRTEYKFQVVSIASRLQVQVNHKTDQLAYQNAIFIYDLLSENYRVTIDGQKFLKIKPIDSPNPLGKRGGSYQYTINFEIII